MKYFIYVSLFDNSGLWLGDYPIGTDVPQEVVCMADDSKTIILPRLIDEMDCKS